MRERQGDIETIQVTADFLVDIDATGAVCGIELRDANEQLIAGDGGKLLVVNQLTGARGKFGWPFSVQETCDEP